MISLARTERAALCNTALDFGEAAPTLSGEWNVKDLIVHLLVRERDPIGSTGILIPGLSALTDRATRRLMEQDFVSLVERVRAGPPRWAPYSLGPVDRLVNGLEYLIHHEDIRRARPGWVPRELGLADQDQVWRLIRTAGKGLIRSAGVPTAIRRPTGKVASLRGGSEPVVITGEPVELALFLFGRQQTSDLVFDGPPDRVEQIRSANLGI